ncbi:MAG: hypothetical protein DMF67_01665 [Acidobacteria bacterium]|nr:MAG: hypothetical protein DMF66_06585 [Acidobacteriota bacterium]PYS85232.1 MAG: hypothetical protein DMF67_01665 [Acidobacteriota bacterium]
MAALYCYLPDQVIKMSGKSSGLTLLILVALMSAGGWLILGSSGVRLLAGYTLVVSSFAVFAFLVRRENTRPLTRREVGAWDHVQAGGRSNYIRKAVVKGLLLGVVSSSVAVYSQHSGGGFGAYDLALFAALVLVVTFAMYYLADRMWDLNEKRSKKP